MPVGLAKYVDPTYIVAPHIALLNEYAIEVVTGRLSGVIEEISVRSGKSVFTSKYLPAWTLGRFPDKQIILTGHEADFAESWGRAARDVIDLVGEDLFHIRVRPDTSAARRWSVQKWEARRWVNTGGSMTAVGVGGSITGRGGNLIICDDPVKDDKQANSKTQREAMWTWWRATLLTRAEPDAGIIMVMSRWHEDDLVGRIKEQMKQGGRQFACITLPALAEEGDLLGREVGEALFPQRYNEEALAQIKQDVGDYWFNALYQQRPRPPEGSLFKRGLFRYFEIENDLVVLHHPDGEVERIPYHDCWCFQTCDPSGSAKSSADYFVMTTWLVTPKADLLVLDVDRRRLEGAEQPVLFRQAYERWSPSLQGIETNSMGITLFQTVRNMGLPVMPLKAEVDKITRALPVVARYEAGKVYHLKQAPWLYELEDELVSFPSGKNDDQVDTVSYGAIVLTQVMAQDFSTVMVTNPDYSGVRISPI